MEEELGACLLIKQRAKEKARYSVLKNAITGIYVVIDNFRLRYDHMRIRIRSWAENTRDIEGQRRMITLTYDTKGTLVTPSTWHANHIRVFMKELKRRLCGGLLAYVWVGELHESGNVHYHVLIIVEKGVKIPYPDKSGIWKRGTSNIKKAKTPFYMLKYIEKEYQKNYAEFPKSMRAFAVWIMDKDRNLELRFDCLKTWQKEIIKKYGWEFLSLFAKPDEGWKYIGSCVDFKYAKWLEQNTQVWDQVNSLVGENATSEVVTG